MLAFRGGSLLGMLLLSKFNKESTLPDDLRVISCDKAVAESSGEALAVVLLVSVFGGRSGSAILDEPRSSRSMLFLLFLFLSVLSLLFFSDSLS